MDKKINRLLHNRVTRFIAMGHYSDVPERNILLGYLVYAVAGWLLLMLPWATKGDILNPVDNLFTAVSAISTTGLATVDVGTTYTLFGQVVILLLVQLGGIGYMTLSSYIIFRLTRHAIGYNKQVMSRSIAVPWGMSLRQIVNNVIHFTIVFEVLGFLVLYPAMIHAGVHLPAWNAAFLSVSSFCTAGLSLFPDSLCSFSDNVVVNMTVAILSYVGAMGFIVITDVVNRLRGRIGHVTFTTKVIVMITGVMTIGGMTMLMLTPDVWSGESFGDRLLASFFQTMSAMTTVGYNSVQLGILPVSTVLVLSLIMFVGASPSGTGGGVKCTSVSVVWGYVFSKLGLREDVTFLGNRIPSYRVDTALTNVIVYGLFILLGCMALSFSDPLLSLSQIMFEATSALGTVGLSMDVTHNLSTAGKLIIISLMYIGRVGVISFSSAFVMRTKRKNLSSKREADLAA